MMPSKRWKSCRWTCRRGFEGVAAGIPVAFLNDMKATRTMRRFAGLASGNGRTARLLRTVANELERLGVRWNAADEESANYFDWATWMTLSPADADYEAVTLKAPRGISGCLLVHRAVLHS